MKYLIETSRKPEPGFFNGGTKTVFTPGWYGFVQRLKKVLKDLME